MCDENIYPNSEYSASSWETLNHAKKDFATVRYMSKYVEGDVVISLHLQGTNLQLMKPTVDKKVMLTKTIDGSLIHRQKEFKTRRCITDLQEFRYMT